MADDMTRNLTIARLLMSLDDQHMAMVIGLVAFYQAPSYEEGYVCKSLPTMKCMQYEPLYRMYLLACVCDKHPPEESSSNTPLGDEWSRHQTELRNDIQRHRSREA